MLAARSPYVEASLWAGASPIRVFFTHILPNTLPVLSVQLSISAGTSLLAEAGLTPPWRGRRFGRSQLGALAVHVGQIHQHLSYGRAWPGLVVTVVVIALNLFGDALRDAIDPLTNSALRDIS